VIVCCPSCQARYRVPEAVETDHGRCSRCHDPVPLVEPRRTYLVRTPGASEGRSGRVVGRLTIGMDDPTLAGRVGRSGLDAPGGAALTFRVFASDLRAGAPAAGVEPPGPRPAAREDPAPPFGIPSYEEAEFGLGV